MLRPTFSSLLPSVATTSSTVHLHVLPYLLHPPSLSPWPQEQEADGGSGPLRWDLMIADERGNRWWGGVPKIGERYDHLWRSIAVLRMMPHTNIIFRGDATTWALDAAPLSIQQSTHGCKLMWTLAQPTHACARGCHSTSTCMGLRTSCLPVQILQRIANLEIIANDRQNKPWHEDCMNAYYLRDLRSHCRLFLLPLHLSLFDDVLRHAMKRLDES